jgi:hypothetical protein
MKSARARRAGFALIALAVVFFALTLLAAFTIFGELAALLAVGCAASGGILLSRADRGG